MLNSRTEGSRQRSINSPPVPTPFLLQFSSRRTIVLISGSSLGALTSRQALHGHAALRLVAHCARALPRVAGPRESPRATAISAFGRASRCRKLEKHELFPQSSNHEKTIFAVPISRVGRVESARPVI